MGTIDTIDKLLKAHEVYRQYRNELDVLGEIHSGSFWIQASGTSINGSAINISSSVKADDGQVLKKAVIRSVINRCKELRDTLVNVYGIAVEDVYDQDDAATYMLVADAKAGKKLRFNLMHCECDKEEGMYPKGSSLTFKITAPKGYQLLPDSIEVIDYADWKDNGMRDDEMSDYSIAVKSTLSADRATCTISNYAMKTDTLLIAKALKKAGTDS